MASLYNLSLFRKDAQTLISIQALDNWKRYPVAKRHIMAGRVAISEVQKHLDKKSTGDMFLCRRIYNRLMNCIECPQDYDWKDDQVIGVIGAVPLVPQLYSRKQHEPGFIMARGRARLNFILGLSDGPELVA